MAFGKGWHVGKGLIQIQHISCFFSKWYEVKERLLFPRGLLLFLLFSFPFCQSSALLRYSIAREHFCINVCHKRDQSILLPTNYRPWREQPGQALVLLCGQNLFIMSEFWWKKTIVKPLVWVTKRPLPCLWVPLGDSVEGNWGERGETKVQVNTIIPNIQYSPFLLDWQMPMSALLAAAGKLITRHIKGVTLSAVACCSTWIQETHKIAVIMGGEITLCCGCL